MPVDLNLLRSNDEGGDVTTVKKWQQQRLISFNDETLEETKNVIQRKCVDDSIMRLAEADTNRRKLTNELNSARHNLKILQKRLKLGDQCNALKQEIKKLKQDTISSLERNSKTSSDHVEKCLLPMIGNQVDVTPFSASRLERSNEKSNILIERSVLLKTKSGDKVIFDPLYCIGGFEKARCSHSVDDSMIVLTGVGSILSQVLRDHATKFINSPKKNGNAYLYGADKGEFNKSHYQITHIPTQDGATVDIDKAHSILGCNNFYFDGKSKSSNRCAVCESGNGNGISQQSPSSFQLPLYAILSKQHQNKNYPESVLPIKCMTITSTSKMNAVSVAHKNKLRSRQQKQHIFAHQTDQISLFTLCECDLEVSQNVHNEMVHLILNFFESLIVVQSDEATQSCPSPAKSQSFSWEEVKFRIYDDSRSDDKQPLLRAFNLSPRELNPNEFRSTLIEGFLPSKGSYVTLGCVSNFTDFVSRSFNTKFGGGSRGRFQTDGRRKSAEAINKGPLVDYVHSVYGSFCDVVLSMKWMLENNVVRRYDNKTDSFNYGIILHSDLVLPFDHLWGPYFDSDSWDVRKEDKQNKLYGYILPYVFDKVQTRHGKIVTRAMRVSRKGEKININGVRSKNAWDDHSTHADIPMSKREFLKETEKHKSNLMNGNVNSAYNDMIAEELSNPYDFLNFFTELETKNTGDETAT